MLATGSYAPEMAFEDRYTTYTCTTRTSVKTQPDSPCPSPSSDYGRRSRSPTPEIKPQIESPRPDLPFSISNILRPEFGRARPPPGRTGLYRPYELGRAAPKAAPETPQRRPDSANSSVSTASSTVSSGQDGASTPDGAAQLWPAWVYCTRYSDRPSSGPRSRRAKKPSKPIPEEKRPRTAFSGSQLNRLKHEFNENRYLTERRRQQLASELGLAEAQIKIWFQNKRAKLKKSTGQKNPLAIQLMAQGLYNHRTATESEDEEEISVT